MIISIEIGNSDDKLTQAEWAKYVEAVRHKVSIYAEQVFFFGGSPNWMHWQNACWHFEIDNRYETPLREVLILLRKKFNQESIAWSELIYEYI